MSRSFSLLPNVSTTAHTHKRTRRPSNHAFLLQVSLCGGSACPHLGARSNKRLQLQQVRKCPCPFPWKGLQHRLDPARRSLPQARLCPRTSLPHTAVCGLPFPPPPWVGTQAICGSMQHVLVTRMVVPPAQASRIQWHFAGTATHLNTPHITTATHTHICTPHLPRRIQRTHTRVALTFYLFIFGFFCYVVYMTNDEPVWHKHTARPLYVTP